MNIQRILVAGGSGFVGSHCVTHLLEKYPDVQIVNIDNLSTGSTGNLSSIKHNPRYHFVHADIREPSIVDAVLSEGIDVVINAVGATSSPVGHPRSFVESNIETTTALLERIAASATDGLKIQRYLQLSTYEVYGTGPISDSYRVQPHNLYGVSKLASDMACLVRYREGTTPVIIVRLCELYGANQHDHSGVAALQRDTDNWLDMKFTYDTYEWLAVQDAANAIDCIMHRGKTGQIYHVGSGEYTSIRDIQKALQHGLALTSTQQPHDYPSIDIEEIIALGWKPKTTFGEFIASGF